MPLDWTYGLIGGLMIGCAGAIYLLVNGRIMGASGIIGALLDRTGRGAQVERLAFLAGLVLVPGALVFLRGGAETQLTENLGLVILAGLLAGIGTRIGSGCTSGHGVCGISRLSPRGIVATIVFIAAGAVTMLIFRQLLGVI